MRIQWGTTFRLLLPKAAQAPAAPVRPDWVPAPRRGRILVIDDEPAVGASLARLLGREHDVIFAGGGRQGLARLQAGERYDLLLCDIMMPDMTGVDVHSALMTTHPGSAQSMVFITGGAFTSRCQAFLDSVPNQRLEKPFEAAALRAIIADRLR